MIEYTPRWKGFQFRSPTYLDGHEDPNVFDLVKWYNEDSCYSVAFLKWNEKEGDFNFESVGTRFLEDFIPGLNEWILTFSTMKKVEFEYEQR